MEGDAGEGGGAAGRWVLAAATVSCPTAEQQLADAEHIEDGDKEAASKASVPGAPEERREEEHVEEKCDG